MVFILEPMAEFQPSMTSLSTNQLLPADDSVYTLSDRQEIRQACKMQVSNQNLVPACFPQMA